MNIPVDLLYAKSHEWVRFEGDTATIGLTDYAQEKLGDIVFINLPCAGDEMAAGQTLGDIESVKAVSDVYCPVTGVVSAINEELLDAPQLVNENPYEAWFILVDGVSQRGELLTAEEYGAYLATLEGE